MSLLGSVFYDPASAASKSTASLLAMTALDTTNLRVTFTTPPYLGTTVLVRLRGGSLTGATTAPQILLGVLDGSTVKGRMAPITGRSAGGISGTMSTEAVFLVTGLTNNTSYTWDAAYGVEHVVASTNLKYGGADDASANTAFGGFGFEVWSTETLLAGTLYDPSTLATASLASTTAMTALDTTNLRLVFAAPASGNVLVRLRGVYKGGTAFDADMLGVLEGSAVRGRLRSLATFNQTGNSPASTDQVVIQSRFCVTGLTPSASYTWDAALGVESVSSSATLAWGGPNNTSADDAYGGFAYDIWDAGGTVPVHSAFASGMIL